MIESFNLSAVHVIASLDEEKVVNRGGTMRCGMKAQDERRGLAMGPALPRVLIHSAGRQDEAHRDTA